MQKNHEHFVKKMLIFCKNKYILLIRLEIV